MSVGTRSLVRPSPVWVAAAVAWAAMPPAGGQMTMHNPHWNITLTSAGYSDLMLDNTPGFEGREYLSGEWAAALAWEDADGTTRPPVWLERDFVFPDWQTNSDFQELEPITQVGSNADGLPITRSRIGNETLEVSQEMEMLDTVTGMPIGMRAISAAGDGLARDSDRYVLRHVYTVRNRSPQVVRKVQLFQLLHGFISTQGHQDSRHYPGTYSGHRHDSVLSGIDEISAGIGSSEIGFEDFIAFHSATEPSAFEIGAYGIEGNGIDNHLFGKPSDGVHLSIEHNWLGTPYAGRLGRDLFQPEKRWLAGAQRWELGDLAPGQSVTHEVILSLLTATRVAGGAGSMGSCLGGPEHSGGFRYRFDLVTESGNLFASYARADQAEIEHRVAVGDLPPIDFSTPEGPVQVWKTAFDGRHVGKIRLIFGYDESVLPTGCDESGLAIYQHADGRWKELAGIPSPGSNTIDVVAADFSPFALGLAGAESSTAWSYARWSAERLAGFDTADLEPDADPDGDGLANLLEYAVGSDPVRYNASPGGVAISTDGFAELSLVRPANHFGVTLEAECADRPEGPWRRNIAEVVLHSIEPRPDGGETVVFRCTETPRQRPVLFLRLRANDSP